LITLYIATHNKTGLKYFGKNTKYHTQDELQKHYHGSGKYWRNHLNKHGNNVSMEIWYQDENPEAVSRLAIMFSETYDIVKSKEWANLKPENGLDGGFYSKGFVTFKNIKTEETGICSKEEFDNNPDLVGVTYNTKWKQSQYEKMIGRTPWNKNKKWDKNVRKNISEGRKKGKIPEFTPESREKLRSQLGKKPKKYICNICKKEGYGSFMKRYHFENCKWDSEEERLIEENKKYEIVICPYCKKEGKNEGRFLRWHFDNCKYRVNE